MYTYQCSGSSIGQKETHLVGCRSLAPKAIFFAQISLSIQSGLKGEKNSAGTQAGLLPFEDSDPSCFVRQKPKKNHFCKMKSSKSSFPWLKLQTATRTCGGTVCEVLYNVSSVVDLAPAGGCVKSRKGSPLPWRAKQTIKSSLFWEISCGKKQSSLQPHVISTISFWVRIQTLPQKWVYLFSSLQQQKKRNKQIVVYMLRCQISSLNLSQNTRCAGGPPGPLGGSVRCGATQQPVDTTGRTRTTTKYKNKFPKRTSFFAEHKKVTP